MYVRQLALLLCCSLVVCACSNASSRLDVVVQTGLVAGAEFTQTRVVLLDASASSGGTTLAADFDVATYADAAMFEQGRVVAEFERINHGNITVWVTLVRADGSTLIEKRVLIAFGADSSVLVRLTRDCVGVVCPRAGDPTANTECLAGVCVSPQCMPGISDVSPGCPALPECSVDSDCSSDVACASGACIQKFCTEIQQNDGCSQGEWCDVDAPGGCTPLAQGMDAGVDGGAYDATVGDASTSDATPEDSGAACGSACVLTDAPPCTSARWICIGDEMACVNIGAAAAGTPCGDDMVCDAVGTCNACEQGAPCIDSCKRGTTDCGTGSPQCVTDASSPNAPAGMPCSDECWSSGFSTLEPVCNPFGSCICCEDARLCIVSAGSCASGLIECSMGGVCVPNIHPVTVAPAGTPCDVASVCDSGGRCGGCREGTTCTTQCLSAFVGCANGYEQCGGPRTDGAAGGLTTFKLAGSGCSTRETCVGSDPCVYDGVCLSDHTCSPL